MIDDDCRAAADRLHDHLCQAHLRKDGALVGPDPGVRINLRVTRFIKSYLRALPWQDSLYYLQAQAYWVLDNLEFCRLTGGQRFRDAALACADVVAGRQTPDGYWEYPQAEWKGRVATVEGCFGALALLAAYQESGEERLLNGAVNWYGFMIENIGFQSLDSQSKAVNYFNNVGRGLVPNNSTLALWFCALLAKLSGSDEYLEHCDGMLKFLEKCQLETGELPYVVQSEQGAGRTHYLCFQYNAYQFLDLAEYQRISGSEAVLGVMAGLAKFLSGGLTAAGDARHDCDIDRPVMHYFTSAVSAALATASSLGLGDYRELATRGYKRLIDVQRSNGGFDYSLGDYGLLSDRRSYPRNQAMILRHLLMGSHSGWLKGVAA